MRISVLAQNIVTAIMRDLSDRKGFDLDDLDADTQREIKSEWQRLVQTEIDMDPK